MLALKTVRQVGRTGVRFFTQPKIIPAQLEPFHIPEKTLDEFIWRKADKWPHRTAVVCGETGRQLTFEQLRKKRDCLAQWLRSRSGLRPGNVVAIVMVNIPDFCVALFGSIRAGLTVTTLNPNYTPDEAAKQLSDSGAQLLFTQPELWPILSKVSSRMSHVIIAQDGGVHPSGTVQLNELCEYQDGTTSHTPKPDDIALLPYSSGTTGSPKGVRLSHRNIVSNLFQMQAEYYRLNEETTSSHQDVIPVILPMYHAYALVIIALNLLSQGCQIVMLPKYRPDKFFELLRKYKPTIIHAAPPLVHLLSDNDTCDASLLERVRYIMCAAAPLAAEDTIRFREKFGINISIRQGYGLTETSPLTHFQRTDREAKAGGAGWCLPATQCRVVNSEGFDQGPGETGEILIYGPQVMAGYLNNPEATTAMIKDGWLHTGDIGHYDKTGEFFVTDRLKELIKVRGFQVAPAELEALLRDHPGVRDAAVIGIPHRYDGERPLAFIVPREVGSVALTKEIVKYISTKMTKHKHLTGGVRFIDAIPRNPSGKILRRQLRELV